MVDVTIVVDALGPQLSGIGRYVWELCRRVPLEPNVGRVGYFAHGTYVDALDRILDGRSPGTRRMPQWLERYFTSRRLDGSVVHAPNYFLPRHANTGIITVHDLSVFRHPETHPADRIQAFERDFQDSLARAVHVITDSETVRSELIADFGVPQGAVTSVHLGVAGEFRPRDAAEIADELAALGLSPGSYVLCVSTLEPRKKIAELICAWRELPEIVRLSNPLVLVGAQGWLNEKLHEEIQAGIAQGWLKHLGYVPDSRLAALYAGARLFLYPSTYEGFGLPPLEAMASGVPVLIANRSCLPEICGDAAGYIDPDDVTGFSEAIATALSDNGWRAQARRRGLERAAAFTWEACITKTVNIYGSVFR